MTTRFSAPDPPSNLTVSVRNGKTAIVYWAPPAQGNYSGFRLRVQSFSDTGNPKTSVIPADAVPYVLRDLIPGATYSLQLFTVLDTKESVAYTSRNFTTSEYYILVEIWKVMYRKNIKEFLDSYLSLNFYYEEYQSWKFINWNMNH